MIIESRPDPPNVKIQDIDGALPLHRFEAMEISYLLVLPNEAFHKQPFCTMNLMLRINDVEDQQRFLRFYSMRPR